MKEIVFASNNKHKVREISLLLDNNIRLLSLSDIGCFEDIPEDQDTLEGNARQKAMHVYEKYGYNCFADDTGLEVEALKGEPGVYSARYSKDEAPDIPEENRSEYNIVKLLRKLEGISNRKAAFRTSICFVENGITCFFEGKVEGKIINDKRGKMGFGYDPVFIPQGFDITFAEMEIDKKNKISHRSLATNKFLSYLNNTI